LAGREGIPLEYVERPAKHNNAAYGTFYDAIKVILMPKKKPYQLPEPIRGWLFVFGQGWPTGLIILVLTFCAAGPLAAHGPGPGQDDGHRLDETQIIGDETASKGPVGIVENTGVKLPLAALFRDENGKEIRLGDIIDRPVILLPAFYTCPRSCSLLISNLAIALNQVSLIPGKDFRVITLSFDTDETPADAKKAKGNYIPLLPKGFPESEWVFLTGKQEAVLQVTDAMGYYFKKTGVHTFVHPNVLVAVSPNGVLIRYVYGPGFLGPDIAMALTEAEKGEPAISVKRILSFCFNYDPVSNRYVFQILKIGAITVCFLLIVFFLFVLRRKKNLRSDELDTKSPPHSRRKGP